MTDCYCFACREHWQGALETHECRVDAPKSLTSPRTGRDAFPISPSESPLYEVKGLDPLEVAFEYGPEGLRRAPQIQSWPDGLRQWWR